MSSTCGRVRTSVHLHRFRLLSAWLALTRYRGASQTRRYQRKASSFSTVRFRRSEHTQAGDLSTKRSTCATCALEILTYQRL